MRSIRVALAVAALCLAGTATAQAQNFNFTVGSVKLEAPLPAGFCLPSGAAVIKADIGVRSDTDNVTHATLYACGKMESNTIEDYFLIKTPKTMLDQPYDREAVLSALTAELQNPNFSAEKLNSNAGSSASKSISEASGTQTAVTTDIVPLGRDKDCAYMGGLVAAETNGTVFRLNVGGCITAVGDRLLMVFRYSKGDAVAGAAKLLPEARKLAMSLRVKP